MRSDTHQSVMVVILLSLLGSASAAEHEQKAVWETREVTLYYVGFTTQYSCDGLRDKVKQVLLALGARRDLAVTPKSCTRSGRPELYPGLTIKLSTLDPAPTPDSSGAVDAHWKTVSLGDIGMLSPGDCELAEQIQKELLPMFTTRNVRARMDCIPHQQTSGAILFTLDVLVPAHA